MPGYIMDLRKLVGHRTLMKLSLIHILRHIPLTMGDWEKRLNSFIEMFDYGILQDSGKVDVYKRQEQENTEIKSSFWYKLFGRK